MKRLSIFAMIILTLLFFNPNNFDSAGTHSFQGISQYILRVESFRILANTLEEASRQLPFTFYSHFISSHDGSIANVAEFIQDIKDGHQDSFNKDIIIVVDVYVNHAKILFDETNPELLKINFCKAENLFTDDNKEVMDRLFTATRALVEEFFHGHVQEKSARLISFLAILEEPESIDYYIDLILPTVISIFGDYDPYDSEKNAEELLYFFNRSLEMFWAFGDVPELTEVQVTRVLEGVSGIESTCVLPNNADSSYAPYVIAFLLFLVAVVVIIIRKYLQLKK